MTKAEIKAWLKATGRNREWLAEQLGLKFATVHQLLYGKRPIPARSELLLAQLMQRHIEIAPAPESETWIKIHTTPTKLQNWKEAASHSGKTLEEWITEEIDCSADFVRHLSDWLRA